MSPIGLSKKASAPTLEQRLADNPTLGLEKVASSTNAARAARMSSAIEAALPELVVGATGAAGAGLAAYHGKNPAAGAAAGGALGALPFLLKAAETTKEAIGIETLARAAASRGFTPKNLPAINQITRKAELYGPKAAHDHAKNVVSFLKQQPKPPAT